MFGIVNPKELSKLLNPKPYIPRETLHSIAAPSDALRLGQVVDQASCQVASWQLFELVSLGHIGFRVLGF